MVTEDLGTLEGAQRQGGLLTPVKFDLHRVAHIKRMTISENAETNGILIAGNSDRCLPADFMSVLVDAGRPDDVKTAGLDRQCLPRLPVLLVGFRLMRLDEFFAADAVDIRLLEYLNLQVGFDRLAGRIVDLEQRLKRFSADKNISNRRNGDSKAACRQENRVRPR